MWGKRAFAAGLALAMLFNAGCAIIDKETTNRGGYLDYVLDRHWMQADSKGMRALRSFAIQVSLARMASVAAKNDADRQLLAIRIGALTKRFLPVYACAFDTNPLGVPGAEADPCFYYDSAMVDYTTGLFDLAMVALPLDDARKLVNIIQGAAINPINVIDLLDAILSIARDALKYGQVIGAVYRDTVELEVQMWLATPAIDDRPSPARVTEADVAGLREIYMRRNDDFPAWLAAIAALKATGREPLAQRRFFAELGGLMKYICGLVTQDASALSTCRAGLPTTVPPATPVLGAPPPVTVGAVIVPRSAVSPPRPTPGVVTPPVVAPPVVTAPTPTPAPINAAITSASGQRINSFTRGSANAANRTKALDWLASHNFTMSLTAFIRAADQEENRNQMIKDLGIPASVE